MNPAWHLVLRTDPRCPSAQRRPPLRTRRCVERWLAAILVILAGPPEGAAQDAHDRFTSERGSLSERFVNPPAAHRILKIIHGWPDQPDRQDALRQRLLAQGFGGVVCNVGFQDYLENPTEWQAFVRAVRAARADGMALWLYDERGYPSGNAGGLVMRDHPEWEAEGLLAVDLECGPGPITVTVPPGQVEIAAAFPIADKTSPRRSASATATARTPGRIDLPTPARGRISWAAPEGRWQVLVVTRSRLYEGTHAEGNLWQKMPYVNLLQAAPTGRFLELTHARYAQWLGPDLGRWFVATFTDEPSLMSLFFRRMPYRPLPWSAELPVEFRQRRGYALAPVLPDLLLSTDGPVATKHRYDFWHTIGDLVAENYFGQIERRCREWNLPSGGHLLAEENIVNHVPLYGDFFACLRRMGAPGIDCLTSLPPDVPWYIARLAASAAELERRPIVMCETSDHAQVWRTAGDTRPKRVVTEAEIRGTCNRLLVAGINTITSYYSFTGLADDALRRLNEHVGRCATHLQGGHQVADVAVVYPVESLWTRFIPAAHWANASAGANRIGNLYRTVLDTLFDAHRDFTVIDSQTIAAATVDGDELVRGPLRWKAVILPGVDTLPLAAWRTLERFARQGGLVVTLGARPTNSERRFPAPVVVRLGDRLFGTNSAPCARQVGAGAGVWLPAGGEVLLPEILDAALEADVTVDNPNAPQSLRLTHRRVSDRDVYFLVNDSAEPWRGDAVFRAEGNGRYWDPADGTSRALGAGQPASLRLGLGPYSAGLVTFDHALPRRRKSLAEGPLTAAATTPLPVGAPLMSCGEFVRGDTRPEFRRNEDGRPVCQAVGTLTRSQVDTFLFVRFPVPAGSALENARWIELETWVPDGQRAPAQLLLILHEDGGGDFLAETSRSLGTPGRERVLVPLNRCLLAGWSTDADGRLDLAKVSEIRVGWGGYYGAEGERVEFSVAAPRVAKAPGASSGR